MPRVSAGYRLPAGLSLALLAVVAILSPRAAPAAIPSCDRPADRNTLLYKIYQRQFASAKLATKRANTLPPWNGPNYSPRQISSKLNKGQVSTTQYLIWKAHRMLQRGENPVTDTPFAEVPLDEQCLERKNADKTFSKQNAGDDCCRWSQTRRIRETTYRPYMGGFVRRWDFVVHVLDFQELLNNVKDKLTQTVEIFLSGAAEGGSKVVQTAVKAREYYNKAKEIVDGVLSDVQIAQKAAKGDVAGALSDLKGKLIDKAHAQAQNKLAGGNEEAAGQTGVLEKELGRLIKQGQGVVNAFRGQKGMKPGTVVYLGNYVYAMRVKGERFVPDLEKMSWQAEYSHVVDGPVKDLGIYPCGLTAGSVASPRGRRLSSLLCARVQPHGPPQGPGPGGGGGEGQGQSGGGASPHHIKVPRIITGSGLPTTPRFDDPCLSSHFQSLYLACMDKLGSITDLSLAVIRRAKQANKIYGDIQWILRGLQGEEPESNTVYRKYAARWRDAYGQYLAAKRKLDGFSAARAACVRNAYGEARRQCASTCDGGGEILSIQVDRIVSQSGNNWLDPADPLATTETGTTAPGPHADRVGSYSGNNGCNLGTLKINSFTGETQLSADVPGNGTHTFHGTFPAYSTPGLTLFGIAGHDGFITFVPGGLNFQGHKAPNTCNEAFTGP